MPRTRTNPLGTTKKKPILPKPVPNPRSSQAAAQRAKDPLNVQRANASSYAKAMGASGVTPDRRLLPGAVKYNRRNAAANAGNQDINYRLSLAKKQEEAAKAAGMTPEGATYYQQQADNLRNNYDNTPEALNRPTLNGKPITASTVLPNRRTGEDLQQYAAKRREERLTKLLGAPPTDEVRQLVEQGARFTGTAEGKSVFTLPNGEQRIVYGIDPSEAGQKASDIAKETVEKNVSDIEAEQTAMEEEKKKAETDVFYEQVLPGATTLESLGLTPEEFNAMSPTERMLIQSQLQQQSAIQRSIQENADLTQTLLQGGNIGGTEFQGIQPTFQGMQAELDNLKKGYEESTATMQSLLEDAKEAQEENLSKQQAAEEERLGWSKVRLARDMDRQKREDHEALVAQWALAGGFGQDGSIRSVMESDAQYDQKLRDLEIEFGVQHTELAAKYSALYTENTQNYINNTLANAKELRGALERISLQGMSNTQARMTAETNLLTTAWNKQNELRQTYAKNQFEFAKEMFTITQEKKAEKAKEKTDAFNYFTWAFSNTDDTTIRNHALKQMSAAGYDTTGINPSAVTYDGYIKLQKVKEAKALEDAEAMMSSASGEFTDGGVDLVNVLRNAVRGSNGVTAQTIDDEIARNMRLLNEGKMEQFRDNIISYAFGKFGTEEAKGLRVNFGAEIAAGDALDELDKLGKNYGGKWKSIIENSKTFFELFNKDQSFAGLRASLGLAQTLIRKENFGANLTPSEQKLAEEFLVAFDQDEAQTMVTKLTELQKTLRRSNGISFDSILGNGVYEGFIVKRGGVAAPQSSQPDIYRTEDIMKVMSGSSGSRSSSSASSAGGDGGGGSIVSVPKENGTLYSGFVTGTVTGYGSKYWKAGLDVSAPKNTPIKTPISGRIESIVHNPSWKGYPNNPTEGKRQNRGFGNQIGIRYPDGVKLEFSHNNSIAFGKEMIGKEVPAGSVVAYVGNTGNTYGKTGVHVDVTGYRPDGSLMSAKEVAQWMLTHS